MNKTGHNWELLVGDLFDRAADIPSESVHTIVFSPPYWALRDYGTAEWEGGDDECDHVVSEIRTRQNLAEWSEKHASGGGHAVPEKITARGSCPKCGAVRVDRQLGMEPTPEEYIDRMVMVCRELWRILRKDGTMWLNIGDSYCTTPNSGTGWESSTLTKANGEARQAQEAQKASTRGTKPKQDFGGIKLKDMVGIPWMLALALRGDGWYLRSEIVWCKKNPMPESVKDRPSKAHEQVFLFSKSPKYFFDHYAAREGVTGNAHSRGGGVNPKAAKFPTGWSSDEGSHHGKAGRYKPKQNESFSSAVAGLVASRNMRSTWEMSFDEPFAFQLVDDLIMHLVNAGVPEETMKSAIESSWETNPLSHMAAGLLTTYWNIPTQPYPGQHFACVDSETEAMTPSGWRRHSDLSDGDIIAIYDKEYDKISWAPVTIHRYECSASLLSIQKRDTSQLLTENHTCLVKQESGNIRSVEARNLKSSQKVMLTAPWGEPAMASVGGTDMAALIGWFVTEGHRRCRQVWITQSLARNPQHVQAIRDLLKSVGASFHEKIRERAWKGRDATCVEFCIKGSVAIALNSLCPLKEITPYFLKIKTSEARALLDAIIDGDGNRRSDGRCQIVQKSKRHIDVMQMLAIRLGYRAHVSERAEGGYALYLTSKRWLTLRGTNGANQAIPRVPYSGIVWCPKTPTGFWLARRNGKPFVTGNTFPEALPERCIKAGTSEKGCCAECGAPLKRVIERQRVPTRPGSGSKCYDRSSGEELPDNDKPWASEEVGNRDPRRHVTDYKTTGWKRTCECETQETVPCTVMDPFAGSGTTLRVARLMGRRSIGIELNEQYAEMAVHRINKSESPIRQPKSMDGQKNLFNEQEDG